MILHAFRNPTFAATQKIETLGSLRTFAAFAREINVKLEGERRQCGVVSTGRRNTLIFEQRWSVQYEVSSSHLLFSVTTR
jgi:hypothetical protein